MDIMNSRKIIQSLFELDDMLGSLNIMPHICPN